MLMNKLLNQNLYILESTFYFPFFLFFLLLLAEFVEIPSSFLILSNFCTSASISSFEAVPDDLRPRTTSA